MQPDGHQYVVNLKEAHFYQKCHDTECYGFRSAAQQLPEPVLGQLRTQLAAGSAGERQALLTEPSGEAREPVLGQLHTQLAAGSAGERQAVGFSPGTSQA